MEKSHFEMPEDFLVSTLGSEGFGSRPFTSRL